MDNEVIGYKDLAAIPKDKAILEVERPDLMVYEPHFNMSALDRISLSTSREVSNTPDILHHHQQHNRASETNIQSFCAVIVLNNHFFLSVEINVASF